MPIKKQDFYEGAALYALARTGTVTSIKWIAPFFLLNDRLAVLLKYSTKSRSPWGFTFTPDEQDHLSRIDGVCATTIGLICADDGVVGLPFKAFQRIAPPSDSAVHIACYRDHGEHYEICGPEGSLPRKISPSYWLRILTEENDEAHRPSAKATSDPNFESR